MRRWPSTARRYLCSPTRSLCRSIPGLGVLPELAPPAPGEEGYDASSGRYRPRRFGPNRLAEPCPVVAVVFPRYEAGADTAVAPVGRGEALVELAKNTFHFKERGASELDLLAELARGVDCYRLTMGELDQAVDLVAALLGATPDHEAVP